ncbi:hypothetical protein [Sphingomonas sp.]|jgi:filamentous hemagglutinin family protein|uniref:beta strand repeat-containing protein n=1 Tax=Sphingomonas sp. TaxID=28214 RepID=UPI002DEF5E8A|nr:hypothetical protein [Sphingomonas sp.]
MLTTRTARPNRRIVGSTSVLALATALAVPAHAQTAPLAYNAPDPTIASGSVNFNRGVTPNVETYTINSPTAVIDFTPSDTGLGGGAINFQNAGSTVTYNGLSGFTVLNRIVPADPSRAVQFNGTVKSLVGSASPVTGGSVWFYSPGGVILGNGAVFDVGSLLLSTGDPTGGTGTISSTSTFILESAAGSNAAITIQQGAQIKASPEGSYVALVAPVVQQNGTVRVNGSAAYVAAEEANLTFSQGLFDVAVTVGSDGPTGFPLIHQGSTTGPASTGSGDLQGIFMVAVPKNTAITMLVAPSGDLGFDVAGSAGVENGAIYLQAGGSLSTNGFGNVENRVDTLPDSALSATISLAGGNSAGSKITSTLIAQASGDTNVVSTNANVLTGFLEEAYLYSGKIASLTNSSSTPFTATKRVVVNAFGTAPGQANVLANNGGVMTFQDQLDIYASSYPGRGFPVGFDVDTGGHAFFQANGAGSSITAQTVNLNAIGIGPSSGATTLGGKAQILATNGGTLSLKSADLNARATGFGFGNSGTGGQALLVVDDGTISITNNAFVDAHGSGSGGASGIGGLARLFAGAGGGSITAKDTFLSAQGDAFSTGTGAAGNGTGGTAAIDLSATTGGATTSIMLNSADLRADGGGGQGGSGGSFSGGSGIGGTARLNVNPGTSLSTPASLQLLASGSGGFGSASGAGGSATAGKIQASVVGGSLSFANGDARFIATAAGGGGGTGSSPTSPGGAGGAGLPGPGVSFNAASGAMINGRSITLDGNAFGGQGGQGKSGTGLSGSGGAATASPVTFTSNGNSQIKLADRFTLSSSAFSGGVGSGTSAGSVTGGTGTAGNAFATIGSGLLEAAEIFLGANANNGFVIASGADGGDAIAGKAVIVVESGGTVRTTGGMSITATASAGNNTGGGDLSGGTALGGLAELVARGSVETNGFELYLDANARGGDSSAASGGIGGKGEGGSARAQAEGGVLTVGGDVDIFTDGVGGNALSGNGVGGEGIGGEARFGTFGGPSSSKAMVGGFVRLDASGYGGDGGNFAGGTGGKGSGGRPSDPNNNVFDSGAFLAVTGGTVTITDAVDMVAGGFGGSGATKGGAGIGGDAEIFAAGGSITAAATVSLEAAGEGGFATFGSAVSGAGGDGTGGTVFVISDSGGRFGVPVGAASSIQLGTVAIDVSGTGGDGGDGPSGSAGGAGGIGTGGAGQTVGQAGSGTLKIDTLILFAQGEGGTGGDGGAGGVGGQGGAGIGGSGINVGTVSGPATPGNSGSAQFGDVTIIGIGLGGQGGDGSGAAGGAGGAGTAGGAGLLSRGAPVTAGNVSLNAGAFGGAGGDGTTQGAGGAATAGRISLLATNRFNRTERGSLTANSYTGSASALPGFGSTPGVTTAGFVQVQVSKADATLGSLDMFATGDNAPAVGSDNFLRVDNGVLDVATGLNISVVGDLNLAIVDNGVVRTDSLSLSATGSLTPPPVGTTPGLFDVHSDFFASFGGDFVTQTDYNLTGSIRVDAQGRIEVGNIAAGGTVDLLSVGTLQVKNVTAGDSILLSSEATVTAGDLSAGTGDPNFILGDVSVEGTQGVTVGAVQGVFVDIRDNQDGLATAGVVASNIKGESISVLGGGNVTLGTVDQGNFFAGIDADQFGNVFLQAAGILATGSVTTASSASLIGDLSVQTGQISAGDSIFIVSDGAIAAGNLTAALGNQGSVSGDVEVFSGGQLLTGNIAGATIDLSNLGTGQIATGNLKAETIGIRSLGSIAAGNVTTGDFYSGIDTSGDAFLIGIGAAGSIALGNVSGLTSVGIASEQGSLTVGSLQAEESLLVLATSNVTATGVSAGRNLFVSNVSVLDSDPAFAGLESIDDFGTNFDPATLATATPVRLAGQINLSGSVSAANIALAASGGISTGTISASERLLLDSGGSLSLGGVSSSMDLVLSSDSVISFSGDVSAPNIKLTSADLALTNGARLGGANTNQLALLATPGRTISFGGSEFESSYSISGAEAQGLRAANVTIEASNLVTVRSATLQASSVPNLTIRSAGNIVVNGAFAVQNASSTNSVSFEAGDRLAVLTDAGGSVTITGSSDPAGTLRLTANNIVVTNSSIAEQLQSNPNFAGRDQALAAPAETPRPEGFVRAGRLELTARDLAVIQNSGTATQFGGFDAGQSMVVRNRTGSGNLDLVIYGRVQGNDGPGARGLITLAAGEGAIRLVPSSTINGCLVTGDSCVVFEPEPEEPTEELAPVLVQIPDFFEAQVLTPVGPSENDPAEVTKLPTINLVTAVDTAPLVPDQIVTDPVSGGGNPSLWETPASEEPSQGDEQ